MGIDRPDIDEIIQLGLDPRRGDSAHGWADYLGIAALIVLAAIGGLLFISTAGATGPGCPGMDPSWIGYCK